jgi:hypothetical protein
MLENTIGPAVSWRLVHNETEVLLLIQTGGYTTSIHTMFEAATEKECLAEITRLSLIYIPETP